MANHPNRSTGLYAVIYPDSPNFGTVLSRHRTAEAAQAAIGRERAAFARSRHSRGGGWLEREVVECERGATRCRRR